MIASASDAPLREAGLRSRSGNAMLRTRTAILDAAAACVERAGVRKTTMSQIALTGGVAKATLYNHFRTKDDVLAALVDGRVSVLGAQCRELAAGSLAAALEHAAAELAASRPLRRVAVGEPALLVGLAVPGEGRSWEQARAAVVAVLRAADTAAGPGEVDLVLRWLVSQLWWPMSPEQTRQAVALLARGLDGSPAGASAVPPQGRSSGRAHSHPDRAGLGWPDEPARLSTT